MGESVNLDIKAIKSRLDAATPGPWEWRDTSWVGANGTDVREWDVTGGEFEDGSERGIPASEADAEFIAHAPADVGVLVAELVRLRADYRTLWGMTLGHDGQPPEPGTADDVERLRARLTDLKDAADGN